MSNSGLGSSPPRRSVTEAARRRQIVDATISTVAEVGYGRASYAQIARQAGLSSTGLISYHFAGKADLIQAVVAQVVSSGQEFMLPRVDTATPGRARLRAYIESNLAFMAEHPAHILAVARILGALRHEDAAQPSPYAQFHARGLAQLQGYLREGQQAGDFRGFSVEVMALAVRAAIDEVAYGLGSEPGLDLLAVGRELADLFERATAIGGAPPHLGGE